MDVGLILPEVDGVEPAELAVRAETLGFASVWKPELWGEHAFVELAAAAERTDDVRLGTAVVNVFSRSPAVIAMGAASLDRLSDGRAAIGLGVSTPKAIEDLHGLTYERPIRRTHETAELITRFLAGDGRVEYDGEVFSVADFPALEADVPVYNAALGPANRRATGRLCDGWLPHNVPQSHLEEAFGVIAETARERGRDPEEITVAPWVHVAVSDDPAEARDAVRGIVAYYVGSGEGYRKAVGAVYPEVADRIASAWRDGDRDRARGHVTDELVHDLGCAGTPEEVREELRALADHPVIDTPLVNLPPGLEAEAVEETLEAVAPDRL